MARITLENVKKSYGKVDVIHGIDWEINDGEFVVIVGPSGCGKSTLLRMIAGLESITSGDISIGDRVVNKLEPAERDIAMVFQNYALYPHMSVYKNMAYGLKIKKIPADEIDRRVRDTAKLLEIEEYLDRQPRALSGGQRQRVAMGRAIVRQPSVFLFDEPLSNLDAKLRVQMRLEIKRLQENLGITSVYVTHDQVEAMTLGHRLAVLNAGYVEQLGTPIEIYERPETVFVAGFIGSPSMNLMPATISADGTGAELAGGSKVALSQVQVPGQSVTFGIRPEHIKIGKTETSLPFTVAISELLGADTLVYGSLSAGTQMVIRLEGIRKLSEGEQLDIGFPADQHHLFDGATGKRI
ncbi:MAG: sn-glycerol-3-phosphate import ATP-binding protein UgpC [Rhodobacteraceae bacterium]|nr:sn-glycerol-3-phosphate import ATP-binding protein UgpC [Paracoccaceae bacterium]